MDESRCATTEHHRPPSLFGRSDRIRLSGLPRPIVADRTHLCRQIRPVPGNCHVATAAPRWPPSTASWTKSLALLRAPTGDIILIIGAVLMIAGMTGHAVGGRHHYCRPTFGAAARQRLHHNLIRR
ncbi:DUF6131 family protein [Nocardia sp. NPDC051570]|uniref:DUF6131 family protein n=1 Tax=Nocardia sp. NPDC051570 TaxID=3364324 RepID=UPI0037A8891E